MTLRQEFIKTLGVLSQAELLFRDNSTSYIKWLEDKINIKSTNSARAEICPWCNGEGLRMSHCGGPMKCRVCEGTGKLSPVA